MKTTRSNLVLTTFAGLPISLVAIYLSFIAFWMAFANFPNKWGGNWLWILWILLGVFGLWSVFTGMRNLLRFDTAHLHLCWHDWIGGLFALLTNITIFGVIGSIAIKNPSRFFFDDDTFWVLPLALPVAGTPIICFCIVAFRFFKHRKKLPCKN